MKCKSFVAGSVLVVMSVSLVSSVCFSAEAAGASSPVASNDALWNWEIRKDRPRIYLDDARLAWLRKKVEGKSVAEIKALAGPSAEGLALAYAITGDKASGRAAIERAMPITQGTRFVQGMTLGIVYDWCYPLLSDSEKAAVRKWMTGAMTKLMATRRSWRSFHNSCYSAGLALGMCSIALAHDDPLADEGLRYLSAEWRDSMKVFDILFPDGEWAEGFDYNRVGTYQVFRVFWALKTAAGLDLMADSPHMKNTPLYAIYSTKANGLVYPGDDNDHPCLGDLDREMMLMAGAEWRDPYVQYFLNHCKVERFLPENRTLWRDLLWYDPAVAEKPVSELPPSRIFRGKGLVMARSGWGWDGAEGRSGDTWVTFKCTNYYGDHCQVDNGHFDVYYKGELAHDSGRYDDDYGVEDIRTSQYYNYYRRSIAHNTILVYDPDEKMQMGVLNDGGQLELQVVNDVANYPTDYDQGTFPVDGGPGLDDWARNPGRWATGTLLAYTGNESFSYACGDATRSYSDRKMRSFVRQFLFIQPDVIVVFDRVVSTKPEFKKTWLLHTVEEPRIGDAGTIEAEYGGGRLVCVPVLPEKPAIAKIGGPGDEFLVAGVHYACGPNASSGRKAELYHGEIPGAWRIELSPSQPSQEDYFLNVMQVTDKGATATPQVKVITNDAGKVVLSVGGGAGGTAEVTFAKGDKPGASLKLTRSGKIVFDDAMPGGVVLEEGRPD